MSVWLTIPVDNQPSLSLKDWSVIELADGERHFVGYCIENQEGRVSSPIQSVDPKTLRGKTLTDRVYQLVGNPGHNSDAQYVLRHWLSMYKVVDWRDITEDLWRSHLSEVKSSSVDQMPPEPDSTSVR